MLPHMAPEAARVSHLPDLIKGDMDSVRKDVRDFYTMHNIPLVDLSSDQDTTDLTKCLLHIQQKLEQLEKGFETLGCGTPSPGAEKRSRNAAEVSNGGWDHSVAAAAAAPAGEVAELPRLPAGASGEAVLASSPAAATAPGAQPDLSAAAAAAALEPGAQPNSSAAAAAAGPGRPLWYGKHRIIVLGEWTRQEVQ